MSVLIEIPLSLTMFQTIHHLLKFWIYHCSRFWLQFSPFSRHLGRQVLLNSMDSALSPLSITHVANFSSVPSRISLVLVPPRILDSPSCVWLFSCTEGPLEHPSALDFRCRTEWRRSLSPSLGTIVVCSSRLNRSRCRELAVLRLRWALPSLLRPIKWRFTSRKSSSSP